MMIDWRCCENGEYQDMRCILDEWETWINDECLLYFTNTIDCCCKEVLFPLSSCVCASLHVLPEREDLLLLIVVKKLACLLVSMMMFVCAVVVCSLSKRSVKTNRSFVVGAGYRRVYGRRYDSTWNTHTRDFDCLR